MKRKIMTVLVACLAIMACMAMGTKDDAKALRMQQEQQADRSFTFTDSLGREFEFDSEIERIAPSGNMAQMIVYSIASDKMVGLSSPISGKAMQYMEEGVNDLPTFGTFYGRKANLNKEALIAAAPEVVIDMGDIKGDMKTDLDVLQDQLGIPVVFIECFLENTATAYRSLGRLIGREAEAEVLAQYSQKAIDKALEAREKIEKPVTVYYSSSPDGLSAIAKGNFHGQVIDLIGAENVVPATTKKGQNQISLEQLFIWDPEVILLSDVNAYETVTTDSKWEGLSAVRNKRVYLIPSTPYSFLDMPPAVNRIIGIYWLGNLLYPELYSDIDLMAETMEFYRLFYRYDLTEAEAKKLLSL